MCTLFSTCVCTNIAPNQQPRETASLCLLTQDTHVSPDVQLLAQKSPGETAQAWGRGAAPVAARPDISAPGSPWDACKHASPWDAGTWGPCGMQAYQMGPNHQQERDAHYPHAAWVPPAIGSLALSVPAGTAPRRHCTPHILWCLESIGNTEKHPDRFLNQTKWFINY